MTIAITIALTALLLFVAWFLGQLPTFWKRLAVVFALSWLGYGAVYLADMRSANETVQAGIAIALAVGAIAAALFVLQPLAWGINDYFEDLDAADAEVQP